MISQHEDTRCKDKTRSQHEDTTRGHNKRSQDASTRQGHKKQGPNLFRKGKIWHFLAHPNVIQQQDHATPSHITGRRRASPCRTSSHIIFSHQEVMQQNAITHHFISRHHAATSSRSDFRADYLGQTIDIHDITRLLDDQRPQHRLDSRILAIVRYDDAHVWRQLAVS